MRRKIRDVNHLPIGRISLTLLLSIGMAGLCWCAEGDVNKKYVILSGKVNVTAACDPFGRDSVNRLRNGPAECEITVERNGIAYGISTHGVPGRRPGDVIADIRRGTIWKNGYLFVPYSCGPGNAWRCRGKYVFAVRHGRLISIGEIAGEFSDGLFHDIYDRLEVNDLTPHVNAPRFVIVMKEENGKFMADLNRTWAHNRRQYAQCFEEIHQYIERRGHDSENWKSVVPPILNNAALAKYCNRSRELDLAVHQAKSILPKEPFALFEKLVSSVKPGEIPSRPLKAVRDKQIEELSRKAFHYSNIDGRESLTLAVGPANVWYEKGLGKPCDNNIAILDSRAAAVSITGGTYILAFLDCPAWDDKLPESIVAVFDCGNLNRPVCCSRIRICRGVYGGVESLEARRANEKALYVAARWSGGDGGYSWICLVFLHIDMNCRATVVKWMGSDSDCLFIDGEPDEECHCGDMEYRFLDNKTVEVTTKNTTYTGKGAVGTAVTTRDRIDLDRLYKNPESESRIIPF